MFHTILLHVFNYTDPVPSCRQLREERPHIECCEDDTQFCPIQCNQGVCRCVDPETGDVVGSGVFFDEGDPTIDCVDSKLVGLL